jgi:pyrroloquinoline-quinone synthase
MSNPIAVEPKLLAHPWYRKWECGELPVESLRTYAREYYWQVAAFPRYLSRLHSQLETLEERRVVLGNLLEEEDPKAPHPELWLDFAEALGLDRASVRSGEPGPAARALVDEFRSLVASSPEEGLGAILAYESQVPEVARFKSKALQEHYLEGSRAERGTRFFRVHEAADVWHTETLSELVEALPEERKEKARQAATRACSALWRFLDAMPH